ncbi:HWE histidine kinase domain-containing protein [Mesorhizobium sp. CAU 1741]|uniref:HWE histidine kinase domain-containing protein n=1 Tax=Mesorhizobium sp. CAU 1741 TaxID=3140366 RepID=UPI00325BE248
MNLLKPVDLTNCDREPIHVPGSIQPHGCLLACDSSGITVLRHSANAGQMLGFGEGINGTPLETVLGPQVTHDVRNALARAPEGTRPALIFNRQVPNGRAFDVAAHRYKGTAIIELEPAEGDTAAPLELARSMIARVGAAATVKRLVADTARLVQAMLGYDRVMIYQFGADGAGKVISESRRPDLESFLGQYFPASDIPQQARALYLKNTIRIISDADFERIPIMPERDVSGEPLDLSFAHLRSVSPIHCEYLRNMGVGASMSISIIVDGVLWGLIACHHYGPRTLTMTQRVAAEMFGEFFSLHLHALQNKQSLETATQARVMLDGILRQASGLDDINQLLRERLDEFGQFIPSDGQCIWIDGQLAARGVTPPADAMPELVRFANAAAEGGIWATHHLSAALPSARAYATEAAGVLIVPLSQRPRDYLFFFRRELVQVLEWAGNPEKTYDIGPLGDRLTPRKSFAIWKETVRHQSAPWTEVERQFGEAARAALVEVALQHSELLADERAKAEIRQRMLNEELNHRVKNILAVIKSLVNHPTEDGETLKGYVETLRGRIQALSLAHDQVIRGGGGGSLSDLLEAELIPYRTGQSSIGFEGPAIWMDARAFSIMALALHELATNAAKYGALAQAGGELLVSWSVDAVGDCHIRWSETTKTKVMPPKRRGFGSTLIERSVPYDLGGDSRIEYRPSGVLAQFRLPSPFVSVRERPGGETGLAAASQMLDGGDLAGIRVLIVEDQLLVALDLEMIIEDAEGTVLATASSAREAFAALERERPHLAILDVNLGDTTSEPIAQRLVEQGIPFMFATGYGDGGVLPEQFSRVPVVSKPYEASAILRCARALLLGD